MIIDTSHMLQHDQAQVGFGDEDGLPSSAFSVAERFFLYPAADLQSLVVWDMERQHTLGQLEGHDEVIRVVATRGSLAVSCQDNGPMIARLWNLETMRCTAILPGGADHVTASVCCTDDKVLLDQEDGIIKLWDIAAAAPVALSNLEGHTSVVYDIKASAAGSMVLSGSDDRTVRLWDLRTSSCVRAMEGHSLRVWSVDMDGRCHTAVSGSRDKSVKLWDLGSGRCMETYEGHSGTVRDVVMHESGSSFLSSGYTDPFVNAWAVGSTRATMRANMASSCVPDTVSNRLFASRDLLTVSFCSISFGQLGLSIWR